MRRKLLAGLAITGLLAGGGDTVAVALAGVPPAAASTVTVTSRMPCHGGPLQALVAKGTITKSQATAIRTGLVSYVHSHWQHMRGHNMSALRAALDTVLSRLVSKGTITKTQASAVTTAFTQWAQRCHAGMMGMMGSGGGGMIGNGS